MSKTDTPNDHRPLTEMEKIIRKTNDVSTLEDHDTLADGKLDAVSGGEVCIEVPITIGGVEYKYKICAPPPPPPPHK